MSRGYLALFFCPKGEGGGGGGGGCIQEGEGYKS